MMTGESDPPRVLRGFMRVRWCVLGCWHPGVDFWIPSSCKKVNMSGPLQIQFCDRGRMTCPEFCEVSGGFSWGMLGLLAFWG